MTFVASNVHGSMATAMLDGVITRGDGWRRSGVGTFREWSHFCVIAPDIHLLVNWSVSRARDGGEVPRLAVLVRGSEGMWDGDAEQFEPSAARLPGGSVAADIGRSRLRYRDGSYEMHLRLERRPIEARLRLRPRARPALTSSIPLGPHQIMNWFVVPRLEASGDVRVGRRRYWLEGAPAYHDHDWGAFAWGGDYSWEWAVALPRDTSCPWSLIFQRISDRARSRTLSHGLLLWNGAAHCRTLHDVAVTTTLRGRLAATGALRVPRVMSLVAPGRAADLPRYLDVRARRGDDVVEASFHLHDLAQVAVPNDTDLGTTVFSECYAEARVRGRVRGVPVRLDGTAIVEMNRGSV